jgi:hypothetical protein
MRIGATALVLSACCGLAAAGPGLRLGLKATWQPGLGSSAWYDSTGKELLRVSYGEQFVGPTLEAEYGPLWGVLSGRADLAQVCIYTSGGSAYRFFPAFGLDVMVEPPLGWRLKPYLWGGGRAVGYARLPEAEVPTFMHDAELHWRAGLGGKFALTPRLELFAEVQAYAHDSWWGGPEIFEEGWLVGTSSIEVVGLTGAGLGARYRLGR